MRILQPCSQCTDPSGTTGIPGSVLEMLILLLSLDVLNQNPRFNKTPGDVFAYWNLRSLAL